MGAFNKLNYPCKWNKLSFREKKPRVKILIRSEVTAF